jgi:hypothetical protein
MNAKEVYKARQKAEQEGVWCDVPGGEIKLKAASARNKEFARAIKGYASGQKISDDKFFEKMVKVCANSVVLDWDGFDEEYTPEAFISVCEELKDCGFLEDVMALAMDKDMFNAVAEAQAEKN